MLTFAEALTIVAVTLPVRLPEILVVEMKFELIEVVPAVFCTSILGAEVIELLPAMIPPASCTVTAVLLEATREELFINTLAPTLTFAEASTEAATTPPTVRAVLLIIAFTVLLPMTAEPLLITAFTLLLPIEMIPLFGTTKSLTYAVFQ